MSYFNSDRHSQRVTLITGAAATDEEINDPAAGDRCVVDRVILSSDDNSGALVTIEHGTTAMLKFYFLSDTPIDLKDLNLDEAPAGVAVLITVSAGTNVEGRVYWHREKAVS